MRILARTNNCDYEHSFLIEYSADSEIELKLEFDEIVSIQSRNRRKVELCTAIQQELAKFKWIVAGSVNVELIWYLHGTQRQETDKVGDIDNISKPILDAITGSSGILIDDSQIGSLHTFWQSRHEMTTFNALYLRISFNNDCCLRKENLYFVQYSNAVCLPVNINFHEPKEILGALVVIKARRMHRATAQKINELGVNVDRMLVVSDWDIHRTRLNGFDKASVLSIVDLKRKCCEYGFTWKLLRGMLQLAKNKNAQPFV